MGREMQRRDFLRAAGASAAGLMLAACGDLQRKGTSKAGAAARRLKGPFRAASIPDAPQVPANPATAGTGGTVAGAPGYKLPLAPSGSVEFTYATNDNYYTPRSYAQNLPVWKEIEKRTGIKIKWDVTADWEQYSTAMGTRLAAGRSLPDMLRLPDGWDPVRAGGEGLVVALNDHINEKTAPNLAKYLDDFPDIRRLITAPDGNIYSLPSDVKDAAFSDPFGLLIRQDWLEKLSLAEPETLDDWYHVLKAFKTKDPGGNGKKDEVPLVAGNSPQSAVLMFGNAFGLHLGYSGGRYVDDKGKFHDEWTDSRTRDLLVWLNKLYKEGLIDPQYYQSDIDMAVQKVTRNVAGAGIDFTNRAVQYNRAQQHAGQTEANWVITKPPKSDLIKEPYYEMYGPVSTWSSVTKDCKHPDLAVTWLDYIFASDEGNTLVTYGLEGETYTVGKGGRLQFTKWVSDNPKGLDPNSALRYYGAQPNTPWIRASTGPLSEFAWDVTRTDPKWLKSAEKAAPYMVPAYPPILATVKESKDLAALTADMNTYRDETLLKFVLGQKPINKASWDEYVSTMDGMGLSKVIAIQQQQYDRYRKTT